VKVTEIIGSGKKGDRDGSLENASFNQPQGLCLVGDFLYICDTENHLLRRVDLRKKEVETVAGNGRQGVAPSGESKSLEISLNSPWDLDYAEGYLYIAMAGSHQIFSLNIAENLIRVFAGSGLENIVDASLLASQMAQPSGISIYKERIYFADSEVSAIRYIDLREGEVKTLVGKGLFEFGFKDGSFGEAEFQHPLGIFAKEGEVFVADTYNHAIRNLSLRERKVTSLIKREDSPRFCTINDRSCEVLPLFEPNDVYFSKDNLYISDTNNHLIRVFNLEKQTLKEVFLNFP
jgi:sugar lactone lactonase YvrE